MAFIMPSSSISTPSAQNDPERGIPSPEVFSQRVLSQLSDIKTQESLYEKTSRGDAGRGSCEEFRPPNCLVKIYRAIQGAIPGTSPKFMHEPFPIIVRELERCEFGYPYLAAFLDSGEDFMIYRRFGFLHTRLLLQKQNELMDLEKALDRMDARDKRDDTYALQRRIYDERRTGVGETRKQLLSRIEEALLKYDHLLLNSQNLVAANRPAERDYKSVAYFIRDQAPLAEGEADFIWNKEDLMTLRPGRETAWLDLVVSRILRYLPRKATKKIFYSGETNEKTRDPLLFLPRKSKISHLVNGIVLFWVIVLFTVPIYALYHIGSNFDESNAKNSKGISMAVLLFSTLLFAIGLALFTKAKRHETLAASAAYCALLVVFIANLGGNAGKQGSVAHSNHSSQM